MRFVNPQEVLETFGLSVGHVVADLGSGSGHYVFAASKIMGGTGTVYAIDIQGELIRHVAKEAQLRRLTNVETLVGDLEKEGGSGLHPNSIDEVIISNTLFQVEHKDVLIREAFRILRNKGRLLVVDWKDSFKGLGPAPEHIVKAHTVLHLAEKAGFTLENEFDPGAHHYALVFRK